MAGAVVLGGVAAALVLVPFKVSISIGHHRKATVRCKPPIASAWKRGPKDELRLWAVTVGTGTTGYSASVGPASWCTANARRRLAGAGVLLGAAASTAIFARRQLRQAAK